jgi:DNA-binding CsgD family transcriptional regulator
MKHMFSIGLLLFVVLVSACSKPETPPPPEEDVLYRVECFYQTNLDSANRILDTLKVSALSEKERAHYCLLRAKVNDGLRKYDDFDSLMQVAEKQFIGGKDKYFESMTYWILSRKAQVKNLGEQHVLDYRLKALQSIEQCRHVDERFVRFSLTPTDEQNEIDRLKYAIHQRLGMSYTNSGYHREGVDHLKLADQYYAEKQNHRSRLITAFPLGMAYLLLGEYDSCLMYYQIGLHSAEIIGDTVEASCFHSALADYYLYCFETQHFDNEEDGKIMLRQSIAECQKGLDDLRSFRSPMANGYRYDLTESLGRAYFDLQQYDSCVHYELLAENMYPSSIDLPFINKRLYNSYKAMGDEANAAIYADKLLSAIPDYGAEQKAVAEVKDEYDKQLELQRLESEQQVRRYRLYLWIALLVIGLIMVLWMTFRYRKNKELETLKLREAQHQLQTELEQLTAQQKEMLQQQALAIYQSGQKDRLQRILVAFDTAYPRALEKMQSAYPVLNESERRVVILSFLGFRAKEVADLLGLTENTAMKYRSNIRKKVGDNPFSSFWE